MLLCAWATSFTIPGPLKTLFNTKEKSKSVQARIGDNTLILL